MLFIPELAIKNIINAILLYIRTDYNNVVDKDDSYLAKQLKGLKFDKYDLYEQAIQVFITRGINDQKELKCFHFFNAERSPIPTIHIMLPDDGVGPNGIGVDNGFNKPVYNPVTQTTNDIYSRSFDSRLNIVITSENSFETILIYRVLQSILITLFDNLQFAGFQNPKISGGDLTINQDMVPQHIFIRAINLDFFYDIAAPTLFTQETFGDLVAQGIAISTETIDESSSI